jgi:hypothetical protein
MAALATLPDVLLLAILQRLSTDDLLGVRFVSRRLRLRGAAPVQLLVASSGELPAAAWRAFPAATRLMVPLDEAISDESLRCLATALPSRLSHLMVLVLARPPHPRAVAPGSEAALAAALSDHFVPQLLAGPAAATLKRVNFESITCAAVDQLLRSLPSLPSLERAHLTTFQDLAPKGTQGTLAAAPPPSCSTFPRPSRRSGSTSRARNA